jgi:erythromycin esterase-like protein
MGEATHGTHEFYQARIELSKYLITKKNFHAVAIEGDWTSTYLIEKKLKKSCINEVSEQSQAMQRIAYDKFHYDYVDKSDPLFYATQNARLVKNAENYYLSLFESHEATSSLPVRCNYSHR